MAAACQVIDFTQRLRERQFAVAIARRLRPGWRLVCETAMEPDALSFFDDIPDMLFAGQKVFDALAPHVGELGGKLATP